MLICQSYIFVSITLSMIVSVDFIVTLKTKENQREVPNSQDEYEELESTHAQGSQVQHQSKKDRDAGIKKMLQETIRTHELLAESLYEAHLKAEGRVVFPPSPSHSDVE